ncbi:hypothetical protein HHK36_013261 [Tetracentron sinense]|uniref:Pentatricopeptide repeat-containing protein n=1 Tax=Tetracentron sinense TaxID=13715 RepID=A0A834ZGR2_TETSI|nr:hypothetical protein HHK36_013261 [Tetracentron sinense]
MFSLVLEAFEEMISYGYTPNTFARNIIMDVLFKIGRVDAALKVLRETQFPNFLTFNIAICNLCKLNDLSGVQDVSKIMLRKGFYPNRETFLMILNCFCKEERLAESVQVLGLMISLGIPPSVTIWSILIDGFCRAGRLVLILMLTCTAIVDGLIKAGKFHRAIKLFREAVAGKFPIDVVSYTVAIHGLVKGGRVREACTLFSQMKEVRVVPNTYTCNIMLPGLCKLGDVKTFESILRDMTDAGIEQDCVTFNTIVAFVFKLHRYRSAFNLLIEMRDLGLMPNKAMYALLVNPVACAGEVDFCICVSLVSRIEAQSEQFEMYMQLDVNTEIYPLNVGDKFTMVLAPTLSLDGTPDTGYFTQVSYILL